MTLKELGIIIEKDLEFSFNNNKCVHCYFPGVEVEEGGCFSSPDGKGKYLAQAKKDYASQLAGQTIVLNAMSENRRIFNIPTTLKG